MDEIAYKNLLEKSQTFKEMEQEDRERIAAASGDDREHFVAIFQDEAKAMDEAYKSFVDKNEQIKKEFVATVKTSVKERLMKAEQEAVAEDEANAETLLKQL